MSLQCCLWHAFHALRKSFVLPIICWKLLLPNYFLNLQDHTYCAIISVPLTTLWDRSNNERSKFGFQLFLKNTFICSWPHNTHISTLLQLTLVAYANLKVLEALSCITLKLLEKIRSLKLGTRHILKQFSNANPLKQYMELIFTTNDNSSSRIPYIAIKCFE